MDLLGKMIAGRYEILEEIGKGGMAYVYKAHCHFLNRTVAVKVLKEELRDDKEFVHRFNTEAQAAARITNPHVVSIYDVGVENGLYYIVMEYVDGITLKEYIDKKHILPWRQAAEFAAQICEGLSAAHKQNVIHRDIKPQNIIMTDKQLLKVTDFGIARATTQATTTTSNSTIGTVHYLSPEQARGGYTNERTDIYSLGVVLYEMLTGRLPFNDNTAVAIAIKHIQEKPVLPRILNSEIPKAMEDIVMKALNKEQSIRYASADEFLDDLKAVIKNPNININAASVVSDMDATVKRESIADEDIENYRKAHRGGSSGPQRDSREEYNKYAREVDRNMEQNQRARLRRQEAIRRQKKKEKKITIAAILTAVVVLAAMIFLIKGPMSDIFGGSDKVTIPNLIDMKLTDAQNQYKPQGFSIVKNGEKASDKEAGTILEQDKAAGDEYSGKDIRIFVIVSSGSQKSNSLKKVEDYSKLNVSVAKSRISDSGFRVNVIEEESQDVAKDTVIRQEPAAGTEASEGSLITLYVSKGKDTTQSSSNNSTGTSNKTSEEKSNKKTDTDKSTKSDSKSSESDKSDSSSGSSNNTTSSSGSSNSGSNSGSSNSSGTSSSSSGSSNTGSGSSNSGGSSSSGSSSSNSGSSSSSSGTSGSGSTANGSSSSSGQSGSTGGSQKTAPTIQN